MRVWLVILFCWVAGPAAAQTVPVKTGEHERFTRIALNIPRGADWRLGRTPTGYAVILPEDTRIDLSGFYDLIPATRIVSASVDTAPNRLDLTVICPCNAVASLYRENWLIVDVRDGAPVRDALFEAPLDDAYLARLLADGRRRSADTSRSPIVTEPAAEPVEVIASASAGSTLPLLFSEPERARPLSRADIPAAAFDPRAEQSRELNELEAAVVRSLERAADQGLLSFSEQIDTMQTAPDANIASTVDDMPSAQVEPDNGELEPALEALLETPGLNVQTSIDSARGARGSRNDASVRGVSCLPDAELDIASWGSDDPFGIQIADRRSAITGEFDRVDPQAVEALAQTYLFFGFGREAKQALDIDGLKAKSRGMLLTLAEIMDDDVIGDKRFHLQAACPGHAGLWGLLAGGDQVPDFEVDTAAIARSFKALPRKLQAHLGTRLAQKLRMLGEDDVAIAAIAPAAAAVDRPIEVALVTSGIALDQGDIAAATSVLRDLAESNARMTPAALMQLINLQISQGQPIDDDQLDLLETMQFEFRRSEEAADLAIAGIEVARYQDNYLDAFERLDAAANLIDTMQIATLRDSIAYDLTEDGDDVTFLETAFTDMMSGTDARTENLIAARLLGMGFAARAMDFVAAQAIGADMTERRYLRAEIALALDDPDLARAHLSGIDDQRARAILGVATPDSENVTSMPEEEAWRSGDWASLTQSQDPLLQDVARRVVSDPIDIAQSEAQLAESRALIDDSAQLRETVNALLDRYAEPEGTDAAEF